MDLSLLLLVFRFIFTVASRLLHLYSTDDKTSRLKIKSFSTLRDTQRGSLFLKTMVCFSGCLMSSASLQKLYCEVCSALKCSFEEFVREKVVIPSYSSAIFTVPSLIPGFNSGCLAFRGSLLHGRSPMKQQGFCSVFQAQMTVIETEVQTGLVVKP